MASATMSLLRVIRKCAGDGTAGRWARAGPVLPKQQQPQTGLPSHPLPGGDIFSLDLATSTCL